MKPLLIFLGVIVFISMVTANLNIGYDDSSLPRVILNIPENPINYSLVNVNNSQFLRGYTPFNLPYYLLSNPSNYYNSTSLDLSDYVPYTGATSDVNLGDNNITADYYFGDGSQLTGIEGDNSSWNQERANDLYWTLDNPVQFGLTGDKDGSFSLYTSGEYYAEQVTSSDDIGLHGYLNNTMKNTDDRGLSIYQPSYTGGSTIYEFAKIYVVQDSASSGSHLDTVGLALTTENAHSLSGTNNMWFQSTRGFQASAQSSAQYPSGTQMFIAEYVTGLTNSAQKTSQANINITQEPFFGPIIFEIVGMNNNADTNNMAFWGKNQAYKIDMYGTRSTVTPASNRPYGSGTTVNTNSYGGHYSIYGNAYGDTTGTLLYLNTITGVDNATSIYDASGHDWILDGDNQNIILGEGQDFNISFDGTNAVFELINNGTAGDLFYFNANVSATGYNTHTEVNDDENALETAKLGSELLNPDGTINHSAFGNCYVEETVIDKDNCWEVLERTEYHYIQNNESRILEINIPKQHWNQLNITDLEIIELNKTECGTKTQDAVRIDCMLANFEQRDALINRNVDLYENLTDFDTGVMVEDLYTQSEVINLQDNYALKFLNASWLDNKYTHKNKITLTQDDLPDDKRDVLSVEDRIVDLEGAFSDHMTCMYLHKKYEDYRDCMFDINPKDKVK